jgi:hypothetical protein
MGGDAGITFRVYALNSCISDLALFCKRHFSVTNALISMYFRGTIVAAMIVLMRRR